VTTTRTYDLTIPVTSGFEAELTDAMEYVRDRLIGTMPDALSELTLAVTRALWQGYACDVRAYLSDDGGWPFPAPEELEHIEAEVRVVVEREASHEELARSARQDPFYAFQEAHADETALLYLAWLESRVAAFREAKDSWRTGRRQALRAAFELQQEAV
jgi:hypothetical protein